MSLDQDEFVVDLLILQLRLDIKLPHFLTSTTDTLVKIFFCNHMLPKLLILALTSLLHTFNPFLETRRVRCCSAYLSA